ncbi:hypothetical protein [Streptomyces sp. NPDC058812]|uniref:hypothetical protein n=1 Tax=unclassified Streptomyces TaxID=2593676 RepID=UPI0036CD94F9
MKKKFAEIGDAEGNKDVVFDIAPDLADALAAAIRNSVGVEYPRHARSFEDLTQTIAQTSHVIQHLEAFRELAIVMADVTGPHADRKAIAMAAGFPPSRLYRVLNKHGRPKDRRNAVLPDADRLQQGVDGMRAALAGDQLTGDQRARLEGAIPELEAKIVEVRAQAAASEVTE